MKKLNSSLILVLALSFSYCACNSFEEDFSNKREGSMMPHKLTPVDRSELRQIVRQGHIGMLSGVDTTRMTTDQKYAYVQDSLWSLKNAFSEAYQIIRSEAERRRTLQTPFTEAEHKSFRDSVYQEQNVNKFLTSPFYLKLKAFTRSKGFGE